MRSEVMLDVLLAFVISLIIFVGGIWVGLLFVVTKLAFGHHKNWEW